MRREALIILITFTLCPATRASTADDSLIAAKRGLEEGRFQECLQDSNQVLDRKPKNVDALKLRALAESGLGRFDDAIQDYESILEKAPGDASIHRDLGLLLAYKKNDVRHALLHLDRYLSLTGDSSSNEAVRTAKLMRSLDTFHSRFEVRALKELLEMAKSFESVGNEKVARETYERALQISPTCSPCHEALGRILLEKYHKDDGEKHLKKARLFGING